MTTIRRSTKQCLAAAASLVLVPLLAACGFGAQTNHQYQSAAGVDSLQTKVVGNTPVDNSKSPIQVYNAAIVVSHVGATRGVFVGTFVNNSAPNPAQGYTASGDLVAPGVTAAVTSISVNNVASPLTITLAPNAKFVPQATGTNKAPSVTVPGDVSDGGYVTVVLTVTSGADTQNVTMSVPVFSIDSQSFYKQFAPALSTSSASMSPSSTPTN